MYNSYLHISIENISKRKVGHTFYNRVHDTVSSQYSPRGLASARGYFLLTLGCRVPGAFCREENVSVRLLELSIHSVTRSLDNLLISSHSPQSHTFPAIMLRLSHRCNYNRRW